MGGGGGGRLFEAGRLLTYSAFRMGAYSRWALIRGWALIRINTVGCIYSLYGLSCSHCLNGHETIGTSLLPKWRPYWKRRSPDGTRTKTCVRPSYYIISKDVIYRLGKSKSPIGVFTLIRSRLSSHPHPLPLP